MIRLRIPRIRYIPPSFKRSIRYAGIVIGLLLLANAAVWAIFHARLYPQTRVLNAVVGNVTYGDVAHAVDTMKALPESLQFSYGKQTVSMTLRDLGISVDASRSIRAAQRQRSWLPVVNLFRQVRLPAPIAIDDSKFNLATERLAEQFQKQPVDAAVTISGEAVAVQRASDGYRLDMRGLKRLVCAALDDGENHLSVKVTPIRPDVKTSDLKDERDSIERQISAAVTIRYAGKLRQPGKGDIAKWFVRSGATYDLSTDLVRTYVVSTGAGFGIKVKNADQAAASIAGAIRQARPADVTLIADPVRIRYSYCVAGKGVGIEYLPALKDKIRATLNYGKGWSLGGAVSFTEAPRDCNFTVWLSSADLMPTFGDICDSYWSCRVGANVVINLDRWVGASSAWNAAGGSLSDYRSMVINHEVGHWLGFGHRQCSGSGQPAPIMQQQSIDLEGCTFNPWPTTVELADYRAKLGF